MKKSGRELQDCTNQIGRGNGQEQQTFEIVRAPEDNHFQIKVRDSKSFKQSHAARKITYKARFNKKPRGFMQSCCCFCFVF